MDMTRFRWAGWGEREEGREGTRSSSQEAKDIKGGNDHNVWIKYGKASGGRAAQPLPLGWSSGQKARCAHHILCRHRGC